MFGGSDSYRSLQEELDKRMDLDAIMSMELPTLVSGFLLHLSAISEELIMVKYLIEKGAGMLIRAI